MRVFFVCIIITLCTFQNNYSNGLGANRDILFQNITNYDGLSQSTVFSIIQDSLGYMWFATQDGLNRYDGFDFKVYRNNDKDSAAVISQHIRVLFNDKDGNLWIGGNKGISRYRYEYDNFTNYSLFDLSYDRYISDIVQDQEGNIWAGSFNGNIYAYDGNMNNFKEFKISYKGERLYHVNELCDYNGILLVGTEYGLYKVNTTNKKVQKIDLLGRDMKIRRILKDENMGIWVGTEGDGLFLLDNNFKIIKNYLHQKNIYNSLCNNNVRSMTFDNDGKLWIGTFIGLSIYDMEDDSFKNYYQDYTRPYTLSQNSIRSLYKDKEGAMWLGTFYGGINFYHPKNLHFDIINQNGGNMSLNDNVPSCIKEDKNGKVWIGTNDGGINCWNRQNNTFTYITHNESDINSLSSNNIKAIVLTDDGKLLVGTHESGLNLYDPSNAKNIRFQAEDYPGSLSSNNIYAILKDHKSHIWLGTWQGLTKFNQQSNSFEDYPFDAKGQQLTSNQITYLFEDSQNRIWIGTFEGVNIFYPEKQLFESFKHQTDDSTSLSNNFINCIYEDSKKRIWIGTNNGLNEFNEAERHFKRFTDEDGLKNNTIYGLLEDDKNRLWISTNQGLNLYNQPEKKFENYFLNDGIQNMQFNTYSFCKLKDGTFLFGGTRGLTIFKPGEISNYPYNTRVLVTGLSINSQKIISKDNSKILNKHIGQAKKIVLKHNQNTVTLNYVAINYIDNKDLSYLTKLENYNDQWLPSGNSTTYLKLPAGDYIFKVKTIKKGVAGSKTTSVKIQILKPWYLTNWAIALYLLLLLTFIYVGFWFSRERLNTLHQLKGERLEKKQMGEINLMKLQFFTNISHEFRTPLTLIISPLEKILEKPISDDWLKQQILMINKNAGRLLNLIDQLLDFRKSETGQLKLNASENDLVHFLNEIHLSFLSFSEQNKITTTFNCQLESLNIIFDKNIVERIFFNLLSNAFKFTPVGGTVEIRVKNDHDWAIIEVIDTGIGIPQEKIALIFERYYSSSELNDKVGTGIGLALTKHLVELHHGAIKVESAENKGTKFIVYLPLSEKAYSQHEISAGSIVTGGNKKYLELINSEQSEAYIPSANSADEMDTILIVEDNIEILNYLKENFRVTYKIQTATNGEDALRIAEVNHPSLIISDIMMPVMNGIQLCKKIKQNIKTSHIPIVLITAKTTAEDQVVGIESGADDYVSKPFSMNVLEAKVNNLIKSRRRLRDYYSTTLDVNPEEIAFNALDKEILEKSKAIIENHLSDSEFSVEMFAREIGMSRSNLHLKLKAITGESATDFIKKIRMGRAVKLLESRKYSVSEISFMVGYSSASYFTTSFKKHFGHRPTEYIEERNKKEQ